MKRISHLAVVALAAAAFALTACTAQTGGDVVAPVTMNVDDLQGATVDLVVGQALNIDTGDLAVDSYTGEVADPSVAEFVPGREDDTATFNPGVNALAAGTTEVTMMNENGGIQPLQFTVSVTEAGG